MADWPINQSTNQRSVTTRVAGHLGPPGYGLVTMTNIAAAVRQTPEQAFAEWAWEMVSRLHLHMMDRGGEEAQGAVNSARQ